MGNNCIREDNSIYQDLSFFSPNGFRDNAFFHFNREVMVIPQSGEMIMKEAPYSHGLTINDIFCDYFKDRFYFEQLVDMVSDDCSLMCELLSLDGCIVLIIENDSCVICLPYDISKEQLSLLLSTFDDLCLDEQFVKFYIWKCLDSGFVQDKIFKSCIILGKYEFNQEKINIFELKKYLNNSFKKKIKNRFNKI